MHSQTNLFFYVSTMKAEIISIGDELLIGQVINTNASWLGEQLNLIGISIYQVLTIPDDESAIIKALAQAEEDSDIIKKFLSDNNLSLKDDNDLKKIFNYYDSL